MSNYTPKVIKEGLITILPDGEVRAEHFHVEGMSFQELQQLVEQRIRLAVDRLRTGESIVQHINLFGPFVAAAADGCVLGVTINEPSNG